MITAGVISDTHIQDVWDAQAFFAGLMEGCFRDVDLVIHAGDLVDVAVLDAFGQKPVYGVRGNMDPPVAGVPLRRVLEIGPWRVGLIHGWGPPHGLPDRVLGEFRDESLDCLIFGHSHQPLCLRHNGILLFNPGSAGDRRSAPFHSVGILAFDDSIEGRIINIDP